MFLLDTNVVSELRKAAKGNADPGVVAWVVANPLERLYVSVVTIQEIETGILRMELRDPVQGAVLRTWLDSQVLPAFADRLLAVDLPVARRAARLNVPEARPLPDGLLAATALVHGMTMVTRNVADFRPTGVKVLNPWDAAAPVA